MVSAMWRRASTATTVTEGNAPSWCLLARVVLALLVSSCAPKASAFGDWTPRFVPTADIVALEAQMFTRLNRDRTTRGLTPLAWNSRLADVARAHSLDMLVGDFFAHESPTTGVLEDRLHRAGFLAYELRENLAIAGDVERAEDNLLESPGHYANIVATTVSEVGIGVVRGGLHGEREALTVTQVFARPAHLDTPEEALRGAWEAIAATRITLGLAPLVPQPLLAELARERVDGLDEVEPGRSLAAIAEEASRRLRTEPSVRGIRLVGQVLFRGAELDTGGALSSPESRAVGVAAAAAHDAVGRPRIKLLVIITQ